jgi:hypothetical protein
MNTKSEIFYWYAYHDEPHRKFLAEAKIGLMIFGLIDQTFSFAVPFELLEKNWENFYETTKKNGQVYKHIFIYHTGDKFYLRVREKGSEIELTEYQI